MSATVCRLVAGAVFGFSVTVCPVEGQNLSIRDWRPEITASAGGAWLAEGDSHAGAWGSVGVGVTLPLAGRLSAHAEMNRMLATAVQTVTTVRTICRAGACIGPEPFEFRSGTSSLTVASAGLRYYFSRARLQPFVGAGLGIVTHRGARLCLPFCGDSTADSEDFRTIETGRSGTAGLRIATSRHVSTTADITLYGTKHYRVIRPSISVGVGW